MSVKVNANTHVITCECMKCDPGVVAKAKNTSTQEAKARES